MNPYPSLETLLKRHAYRTGDFTLASGQKSTEYLSVKTAVLHPGVGAGIARALKNHIVDELALHGDNVAVHLGVAGVPVGGDALAWGVCHAAWTAGHHWPCLLVRKEVKQHGEGSRVEGEDNLEDGVTPCVLVEDVITTGGSVVETLRVLESRPKLKVVGVAAVVDRQEGGPERIKETFPGVWVFALTTLAKVRTA